MPENFSTEKNYGNSSEQPEGGSQKLTAILYISYDGLTDPLGQSQVLPYLVGLSAKGYQCTILSFEKKDRYEKGGQTIQQIVDAASIHWVPLMFTSSPPVLSKIYDLRQMKRTAVRLHRKMHFDLVHCRSYIAAQAGMLLKKKFGVPFVFDMRGFWADEKKDSGHWSGFLYGKLYAHYKNLEKKLLASADAVISLTVAAKNEMAGWNIKGLAKHISIIPCCADLELFDWQKVDEAKEKALKIRLSLADAFPVIGYLGSIGGAYGIREMVLFFSVVKKKYPRAQFLFLTKDDTSSLMEEVKKYDWLSATDIHALFAKRADIPDYIALMDYSIFFYKPSYSRLACSPTKFAELSGMGVPVICNAVGDLNNELLGNLHTVIPGIADEEIRKAAENLQPVKTPPRAAIRDFALRHFSLADGVERYAAVYESVLKK